MNIKQDILNSIAANNSDYNANMIQSFLDEGYVPQLEQSDNGLRIFLTKGAYIKDITLAIAVLAGLSGSDIDFDSGTITASVANIHQLVS